MTVDNYVIWSVEHDAWWGPNHHGYVRHVSEAGVYSRAEAEAIRDRAYIGWTRDTDPPEVLVPAFVGVSPTMATLAAAAVETARAGWSARDAIATRELDAAYRERAHLVAHLAAVYPSVWVFDETVGSEWRVVYVTIPASGANPGRAIDSKRGFTISATDADLLEHRWYNNGAGYMKRQDHLPAPNGYLYRVIAERIFGYLPEGYEVDHVDRNPLNNTRWNLRLATPHAQKLNSARPSIRQRRNGRWQAMRNDGGRQLSLGMADTEGGAMALAAEERHRQLKEARMAGELIEWTTQLSWHISPADWDLFPHVSGTPKTAPEVWDGHSTAEKYRRLDAATKAQGQWQENLWVRTGGGDA